MLTITQANIKQSQIELKGIGRDPCVVTVETTWSYQPLSALTREDVTLSKDKLQNA